MVYLIGPDGLINRRFANFHKMVWMTTVHVIHIHAVFWKFAYPQFTGYAEYIRFYHREHLMGKALQRNPEEIFLKEGIPLKFTLFPTIHGKIAIGILFGPILRSLVNHHLLLNFKNFKMETSPQKDG